VSDKGNEAWIEKLQASTNTRVHAARTFFPELKAAFLALAEHEPVKSLVKIDVAEEDPRLFTVSAGLFHLKFATDDLSDTIFYAFTSAQLKRLIPTETAIFHYGQIKLSRSPWGVIDNVGEDVPKVFVDAPQSVQYFPLADQVARWSIEQLLGGYPDVMGLEEAATVAEETKEKTAKKEAERDSSRE
jgi:hypothetical protein